MAIGVVEAIYKLKYFIICRQKTQGKWQEHRENTGNLILIGACQPCFCLVYIRLSKTNSTGQVQNFPNPLNENKLRCLSGDNLVHTCMSLMMPLTTVYTESLFMSTTVIDSLVASRCKFIPLTSVYTPSDGLCCGSCPIEFPSFCKLSPGK